MRHQGRVALHMAIFLILWGVSWLSLALTQPTWFQPSSLITVMGIVWVFLLWLFPASWISRMWKRNLQSNYVKMAKEARQSLKDKGLPHEDFDAILKTPGEEELKKLLKKELRTFANILRMKQEQRMDWNKVSKSYFHIDRLCEAANKPALRERAEVVSQKVQALLGSNLLLKLLPKALAVFILFVGSLLSLSGISKLLGVDSYQQFATISQPFAISMFTAIGVFYVIGFWSRYVIEKTPTEIDDIVISILIGPISTFILIIGLYETVEGMEQAKELIAFLQTVWALIAGSWWRSAITIAMGTWLATFFFNRLIIHALKKWAERTAQKYDDMFVAILQVFGTFMVVAVGIGVFLFILRDELNLQNFGADVILPYSIIVSVFSAILGYASKDAIENFLGGALLMIDNPFNLGDRLVLATGEICDVREVGMRSTKLYNIVENTEIYIPNSVLATQTITNISRPDSELRIQIPIYISAKSNAESMVMLAEEILMDMAYADPEVENSRIEKSDVDPTDQRTRSWIKGEIGRLTDNNRQLAQAIKDLATVSRGQERVTVNRPIDIETTLDAINKARKSYQHKLRADSDNFDNRREDLRSIMNGFETLEEALAILADRFPELKGEMETLISELAKEPDVHSEFQVTDDGCAYIKLTFGIFTTHLERRFEVAHKLNKQAQERFSKAGIKFTELC